MAEQVIRFEDADAYERGMSPWSRLAGARFLDWLAPPPGLRWLDVGCGTGAFSALVAERYAPMEMQGIDPSEAQLRVARARLGARGAAFVRGDAMALPFERARFDAVVMALVIFFVPDPAQGVAEMVRVARPGGLVAAYAWDLLEGGFPFDPIWQETRAAGITPLLPPNAMSGGLRALGGLWRGAGPVALAKVEAAATPVRARRTTAAKRVGTVVCLRSQWCAWRPQGDTAPGFVTVAAPAAEEHGPCSPRVGAQPLG